MLADNHLRFNSKDAKVFVDSRILVVRNPRVVDVSERIDRERRGTTNYREKAKAKAMIKC